MSASKAWRSPLPQATSNWVTFGEEVLLIRLSFLDRTEIMVEPADNLAEQVWARYGVAVTAIIQNHFLVAGRCSQGIKQHFLARLVRRDEVLPAVDHQCRHAISRSEIPRIDLGRLIAEQPCGHE